MKERIQVSHEMITLVGKGPAPAGAIAPGMPDDAVIFLFPTGKANGTTLLEYRDGPELDGTETASLVLVVARKACERLFAARPERATIWHLPSPLLALANSIIACEASGEARVTLRLARSIELLCQIHAALADGATLVATGSERCLGELDVARISAARRAIDESWHQKLTIPQLARIAGVNRDKLVRGFHEIYGTTIAQVLAERRLAEARRLLLGTDLPVSTIAYRCSYLNNAAFTRAFNRRFGIAPSALRRRGLAA